MMISINGQPSLKASPSVITGPSGSVTVSWSGLTTSTTNDFLAIYSPSTGVDMHAYIGWIYLSNAATYTQGFGELVVPNLVNMRTDYSFRVWTCNATKTVRKPRHASTDDVSNKIVDSTCQIQATSNPVTFAEPLAPAQGHLALTQDPTSLSLLWVSGSNATVPTVYYGLSSTSLSSSNQGTTITYGINSMCDAPANNASIWKNPGFIHSALIINLKPSTQYFYKFGSITSGWSQTFSFISPQAPSVDEEIFVVAYGDMGVDVPFNTINDLQPPAIQTTGLVQELITTPGSSSPFSHLSKKYGDSSLPLPWTLLHIGDISYARGYGFLWDYFFNLIQPVATQVPYMVCIGNHEYDYTGMPWRANDGYGNDSGGECGIPYSLRFNMPGAADETKNLWYSFNQGPVHFVFMSSEHDFVANSPQYNWILNDLANVDKQATPWIVFSGHRPAYTSSHVTTNETTMIRETYEPLWIKFRVNLCLWGHVHVYERTCGVQNSTCIDNDAAPVHVVIGMAGNDYQVPWYSPDLNNGNGHAFQPAWSVFRTVNYGYSRFFANATDFNFQFVGDQRGEIHDNFWLTQF